MKTELNNEVASLREELKERIENQNTFAMALIEKPEREVARLRELIEEMFKWDSANRERFTSKYEQIRTRRPLPVQEEKWVSANPPLEKELRYIENRGTSLPDSRRYIADSIRYIRDEIQKLKEAK